MIRPHSKARQKQLREYAKERSLFLGEHPRCEAHAVIALHRNLGLAAVLMIPPSEEIHHKRGRIGDLLLEKEFWLAVCWVCHGWINAHIGLARKLGLIAPLGQWNQTEKLRQQKERNAHI